MVNPPVPVVVKVGQHPPVPPKLRVDIPYIVVLVTVETVIVIVPALV